MDIQSSQVCTEWKLGLNKCSPVSVWTGWNHFTPSEMMRIKAVLWCSMLLNSKEGSLKVGYGYYSLPPCCGIPPPLLFSPKRFHPKIRRARILRFAGWGEISPALPAEAALMLLWTCISLDFRGFSYWNIQPSTKTGCLTWPSHLMLPLRPPCTAEVLISRLNRSPTASAPVKEMFFFPDPLGYPQGIWMHMRYFWCNLLRSLQFFMPNLGYGA